MSGPLSEAEVAALEADITAAEQEVFALCKGEHVKGGRRFRMTIPVEQTDSDIVLIKGLDAGRKALATLDRAGRSDAGLREARLLLSEAQGYLDADADHGDEQAADLGGRISRWQAALAPATGKWTDDRLGRAGAARVRAALASGEASPDLTDENGQPAGWLFDPDPSDDEALRAAVSLAMEGLGGYPVPPIGVDWAWVHRGDLLAALATPSSTPDDDNHDAGSVLRSTTGREVGPKRATGVSGESGLRDDSSASAPDVEGLNALNARGWLKHTNGCSWEVRKEDGSKECDCGLLAALWDSRS